jgi:hypothetical protein
VGTIFGRADDSERVLRASAEGRLGMLFSVNKMLRSLSNAGRGFCVGRSRVSREIWVADFAMSGWVELAQMCGYLAAGTV